MRRARCAERRTPGSAGGPGKPTRSNPGRAPRPDPTGVWRVSENDPDSELYAASRDADTVIRYMAANSDAAGRCLSRGRLQQRVITWRLIAQVAPADS